jgi:hypothetical protein
MTLVRITCEDAQGLLSRQIGDYFPISAQQSDWYATPNRVLLGVVIPTELRWRFVLLKRGADAKYSQTAAGERESQDAALYSLKRAAAWLLADKGAVWRTTRRFLNPE